MLYYAVVFFIVALIAAVFGFTGLAAGAAGIAKILFVLFLIGAVITFFLSPEPADLKRAARRPEGLAAGAVLG